MPNIPRYSAVAGSLGGLQEAIKRLTFDGQTPLDTKVLVWDPDGEDWFPITGFIYDSVAKTVKIYSDE